MAVIFLSSHAPDLGLPTSQIDTGGTGRDSAYSPASIAFPTQTYQGGVINLPSTTGTFWFHFRWHTAASASTSGSGTIINIVDGAGVAMADVQKAVNSNALTARALGSSTISGAAAAALANSTTVYMDIKLTVGGSGGSIVIELYHNSVLVSTATATNSGTVKTQPRQIFFFTGAIIGATNSAQTTYLSEIICTTGEDTRGMRLATLNPASIGSDTAWAGGVAADMADADNNTGALATSNGQRSSWNPSAYGGPGSPTSIRGVFLKAKCREYGGALTKLNQYLKIGGTDYDGSDIAITGDDLLQEFANNPATSAPWLTAAFTAQMGIEAVT